MAKRKGTITSPFGVSGRKNHDSTPFYNSNLYSGLQKEKNVEYVESLLNKDVLNKIFPKSSENMDELPDNSVHLMVTSPPYNVGKEYDKKPNSYRIQAIFKKNLERSISCACSWRTSMYKRSEFGA